MVVGEQVEQHSLRRDGIAMTIQGVNNVSGIATGRQTKELLDLLHAVRIPTATMTTRGTFIGRKSSGKTFVLSTVKLTKLYAGGITSIDQGALSITIAADEVVLGANHASSAETVVSIGGTSGSKHYIYAFGSLAPLSIAIAANTTGTFPVHAANQWRRALYEVYVESGAVVVNRILHLGVIDLTGFYS